MASADSANFRMAVRCSHMLDGPVTIYKYCLSPQRSRFHPAALRSVCYPSFGTFRPLEHRITVRSLRNLVRFLVAVQLLPALESGEETLVGGQAVLEGVMMRSPHAWAIACRKPSGEVVTMSESLERPSEKHKWMAWPIVRGVMTLGYAMSLGYRALRFSANVAIEDVMQSEDSAEKHREPGVAAPSKRSEAEPAASES